MTEELAPSIRRVSDALTAAGVPYRVVQLPRSARTAIDAAAAIGCGVERIAKSLVFRLAATGSPVLVIASGPNRVDEKLVASYLGGDIVKADAAFVRSTTGFVIGGVPPLGHVTELRTLVDRDLMKLDSIWAAAGTPDAVFSADPRQLVRAIGAQVVPIAKSLDEPVRFETGRPMLLAGLRRRHPLAVAEAGIAGQWRDALASSWPPGRVGSAYFGVMCGADTTGLEYMCAIEVESLTGFPADTGRMRVPAQTYAVFHHGGGSSLRATWEKALAWLSKGSFESAHLPDFEVYAEGCDPLSASGPIEIWIGVVPKKAK